MTNQTNTNTNENKPTMLENIQQGVGNAMENTRAFVHEHTKSKEQKEAEKPVAQKVDEATPDSAKEAGQTLGQKLDEGAAYAQDKIDELKKENENKK